MVDEVKFRHEQKYICSTEDMEILNTALSSVTKIDPNAGDTGWYHIRSIYFDDLFDSCLRENEDGVSPREKWRIRSYNCDKSRLSLECKRKEYGMIRKTSCLISQNEFEELLGGRFVWDPDRPVLNRFCMRMASNGMTPKVVVGYDRMPFVCSNGNVRVTFDCHIFSSPDIEDFFEEHVRKRMVLPHGQHLLEVKFDEFLPDYIYHAVQLTNMRTETFSKYYLCRKYAI